MRIGIDFRLLSAGPLIVHRGMGRYSQQQLREVLRLEAGHQFVLFCREDADVRSLLPEIALSSEVSIAWLPSRGGRSGRELNRPEDVLRETAELQRAIDRQEVDLFHATTPCLLDDLVPFRLDGCPLVATHYDLIPLVFPAFYLGDDADRRRLYRRALDLVRQADRLVALTRHGRREVLEYLGIPPGRVHFAHPLAEPCFRPLPAEERESLLQPLRERLRLEGELLLTVSHTHHAKNLPGLFDAYRQLPAARRRELPLVVAGDLEGGYQETVRRWAEERGIGDHLVLPGFVTDEELTALYNAACVYVHPSLYEGFGLPVLEAMRCGTAVIAAGASSLPEVVGDAGRLFDPEDPAALAQAIEELVRDPALRRELGERALLRAGLFRPEGLGRATLAAYEEAVRRPAPRAASRVALWTPLPPQESGISDYSVELVRELVRRTEVEVFADDVLPEPGLADLAPIRHFQAFETQARHRPFDAILYQMGASLFHLYMAEPLRRWPGIVTLHDLTWGAVLHRTFALWGDDESLRQELIASEGEEAWAELLRIREGDPATLGERIEEFLGRRPMLRSLLDSSLAQIVHMPQAERELREQYPGARPFSFPMGVDDPLDSLPPSHWNDARSRLGLRRGAYVIGTFGNADPVKRLESLLLALAQLVPQVPDAVVLVVGSFYDPGYRERLVELSRELGIDGRVRFLGRVAKQDFDKLLLACDAVVNLRFPFRKQMSATLMRAIAAGKPVLISEVEGWDHLPATFCLRVPPGEAEVDALAAHLLRLAGEPDQRRRISEAARHFYLQQARPEQMASSYCRVIEEVTGHAIVEPQEMSERERVGERLPYNKPCELEDFADPTLAAILRDLYPQEAQRRGPGFPRGFEHRRMWEAAMSVRALQDFGALRPDAEILGAGAGMGATPFYLTGHVRRVVATDLYLAPRGRDDMSPRMLTAPESFCPFPFERDRLIVQHMDGRLLRFPDASFDAVFSANAVEHLGDLKAVAQAAFEMGRVLKPGGVLALAAEYRISGPPGGHGHAERLLLSLEELRRYVLEASGLEPVDELQADLSERTLTTRPSEHQTPALDGKPLPYLITVQDGYVSGSVHLALRKTGRYPASENEWARASEADRLRIERQEAGAGERLVRVIAAAERAPEAAPAVEPDPGEAERAALVRLEELYRRWDDVRARSALDPAAVGSRWSRAAGFPRRAVGRILRLGVSLDFQRDLFRAFLDRHSAVDERLRALEAGARQDRAELSAATSDLRAAIAELREAQRPESPVELPDSVVEEIRGVMNELRAELVNLRDRQETLRVRQSRVEADHAASELGPHLDRDM